MGNRKIFVASAWPYVNGDVHIGHLAGYFIPADIFSRYSRLKGLETLWVSGSDCHGTPITVEADKRGISAADLVAEYVPKVNEIIKLYNFSYDLFTTTTTENHKAVTQDVFLNLLKNGFISKRKSLQYFSAQENKFLPDRYVEGECPYCHSKDQRADQCENCGRSLGLGELINPHSKLTKSDVELKETEHYFVDFDKLAPEIKDYVSKYEGEWKDWVWKETMGFINEGLQPRAITRDLDWGIEIPKDRIDPEMQIENIEQKKFYVWFEAVIGYLSAAKEYCDTNNKNLDDFWKNSECTHYYFMGQDNLTFHTIFWPGQLLGQNLGYNLPSVPGIVKFLNANGQKLSKSRGNIIDAKKVAEHFGAEAIRYYILSILPENKESNWDWTDFKNTINSDLGGNIGNFVHRVLTFYKNKIGSSQSDLPITPEVTAKCTEAFVNVSQYLEKCQFVNALNEIKKLSTFGNQYFDHNKPWEVLKTDKAKAEVIINDCLQIVESIRVLINPILPEASDRLSDELGLEKLTVKIDEDKYVYKALQLKSIKLAENLLPLFKKIEDEVIESFKNS